MSGNHFIASHGQDVGLDRRTPPQPFPSSLSPSTPSSSSSSCPSSMSRSPPLMASSLDDPSRLSLLLSRPSPSPSPSPVTARRARAGGSRSSPCHSSSYLSREASPLMGAPLLRPFFLVLLLIAVLALPRGALAQEDTDKIYWTLPASGEIQRADLDGGSVETAVTRSDINPKLVFTDEKRCLLYYADESSKAIMVMPIHGESAPSTFVDLSSTSDYVVAWYKDTDNDLLYFTTGQRSRILRTSFDPYSDNYGALEEHTYAQTDTLSSRVGLAVDTTSSSTTPTIYYANAVGYWTIYKATWGTASAETFLEDAVDLELPGVLFYHEDYLYFADEDGKALKRLSASGGAVETLVDLVNPIDIFIDAATDKLYFLDNKNPTFYVYKAALDGTLDSSGSWPVTLSALPGGLAKMAGSSIAPRCFTSTTTTTSTSSTTVTTITATTTTHTRTTTTATETSTTETSTTTSTMTTTSTTLTTTSTTTATETSTTLTSTTSTSSTTTSSSTTLSSTTSSTTTSSITTSSTSTATTSTSTSSTATNTSTTTSSTTETTTRTSITITTTSTITTMTMTTTRTTLTGTSTSTEGTSTTSTTTLHSIITFIGSMSLSCASGDNLPTALGQNEELETEIEINIADSLPGVEAHEVTLTDLRVVNASNSSSGRRLAAAVLEIDYEIVVAEEVAAANSLNTSSITNAEASLLAAFTESLVNSVGVEVTGLVVATPEAVVGMSATTKTETTTTSVTTTTTTPYATTHVVLSGRVTFYATDLSSAHATSVAKASLVALLQLDVDEITITVAKTRRLRRLAMSWTTSYKIITTPVRGVVAAMTANVWQTDVSDLQQSLIANLVKEGYDRDTVEESFVLTAVTRAAMTSTKGPEVTDACGTDLCQPYWLVKDLAPLALCQEALNCSQALLYCCEDDTPISLTESSEAISKDAASAIIVTIVVLLICTLGSTSYFLYMRHLRSKERRPHGIIPPAPPLGMSQTTSRFEPTRTSVVASETYVNDDEALLRVLNDLKGAWRVYELGNLVDGTIDIGEDGYVLYNDIHFEEQDMSISAGGIMRMDGWLVDMHNSDTDCLRWLKEGEAPLTWKRVKGLSTFGRQDVVEWVSHDGEVPLHTEGRVKGFTDTRLRIEFGDRVVEALPEDVEIVRKSGKPKDKPRGLATLALCVEFKRMGLFVQAMSREHTNLSSYNDELRSELSTKSVGLSEENSKLRLALEQAEEQRRQLTMRLASDASSIASRTPRNMDDTQSVASRSISELLSSSGAWGRPPPPPPLSVEFTSDSLQASPRGGGAGSGRQSHDGTSPSQAGGSHTAGSDNSPAKTQGGITGWFAWLTGQDAIQGDTVQDMDVAAAMASAESEVVYDADDAEDYDYDEDEYWDEGEEEEEEVETDEETLEL